MLRMPAPAFGEETDFARHVRLLSTEQWGESRGVSLVGHHPSMLASQEKVLRFAQTDAPVLIVGETGTGKEIFARALYLLSGRRSKPFLSVNCAQYSNEQLIASELFGHKRGSFTGAVSDHRGVFEEADGGVVFLDEVGELPPAAQAMLLRTLGEGEIIPIGCTRARAVNVRVIAATNRDLRAMVAEGKFREDLLYRLSFLQLGISALRDRGDDWRLMLDFYVRRLNASTGAAKRFSEDSLQRLALYGWPGNVRELRGVVEMGHCLCNGSGVIEPVLFEERLGDARTRRTGAAPARRGRLPRRSAESERISRMTQGDGSFWDLVYEPFMDRELNRREVQAIIAEGLRRSNWSYKRSLRVFGIAPEEYLKFMDFLRHHRLKPER